MDMETVEHKHKFDKWAAAFNIEQERRDRLWAIMVQNGMDPQDSTTYFLLASGVLEKVAGLIETSNKAVPDHVEAAAKRAVGPIAAAAAKSLEARLADQSKKTDAAFEDMMQNFTGTSNGVLHKMEQRASNMIAKHYHSTERRDLIRQYSHIAGVVALVAFLGLAGAAWVFHGTGFASGRAEAVQVAGSLSSLASRPDATTIALLAANNPDFTDAINAWCGTGSANLVTVENARRCGPFWIDTPPIAGDRPATVAAFWNVANAPLRAVDPLAILAGGIGLAALGNFLVRRWRGK